MPRLRCISFTHFSACGGPVKAEVDAVGFDGFPTMAVLNRLMDTIIDDEEVTTTTRPC